MGYQAIYRKFRPKTFQDVLGQEHVTTTLKNQILSDNIAHAYLFSGTRGTGKTSTAKIFARAVNCLNNNDGNPCNECEVCRGILDETIMDVVEMDAASNNSVDDIRELREKVKYLPSKGKYKVYIIDEVHMLSKGAFNALLKTLEEPPKHLLFILATTEPQRIPATILSRCQRFDFKRITTKDIVKNMKGICSELGIEAEDKALHLIARNSDGAMRDALSILDQCVSFTDDNITYEYVLSILGTVNNDLLFEISDGIIDKDLNKVLGFVDEMVQKGKDIHQFIKDLILHFRNLMIAKSTDNFYHVLDTSEEVIHKLKEQAKKVELESIIRYLNVLSEAEVQSKWSSQPRIILEISMVKLLSPSTDSTLEGLSQRVKEIEKLISQGRINIQKQNIDNNKNNYITIEKEKKQVPEKTIDKKKEKNEQEPKIESKEEATSDTPVSSREVDFKTILSSWSEILQKIKSDRISIHALLMEGEPVKLEDNTLIIAFGEGFGFHKEAVAKKENKQYIENMINTYLGTNLHIKCAMKDEIDTIPKQEDNNNLVEKIKDIFGEDIVEVE
ncbi:DNA polymerase III subunit gamma/tau [Caldisalinibacter kiritimatiensis]|uniref:DNA-directed DNA polymerase n=1 Tax=Caldisalinibacter kiritimatiensis TaxID=1304284 RepID=R1CUL8_9FIRM|nr:DNA polymerase III subunit gamma/tau [Caldisalinibacter kiritimatiensis]EOD00364.1 DNA polymerase III subunits gamma and tau [Caldisalinibacter kiritimatiensis]